jgi:DNA-binding transcriptional LysR family regulator
MDINELFIFAKVVQHKSFTGAARDLSLPKSTVSRKISELETRLGVRLLQRTTRHLSLTDAGQVYHEYCARIVSEAEDAERAVTSMQGSPRGRLRVTAPLNFGFLGSLLGAFLLQYKDIELEIICTDRVVDLIEEGFDIGIRAGILKDSSLISKSLGSLAGILAASPTYLKKNGTPQKISDLNDHSIMLFGAGEGRFGWQLRNGSKTASFTKGARIVVNDQEMLYHAAISGLGICMLPAFRCAEGIRKGSLTRVLPEWSSKEISLSAVYPSARHLSAKVKVFLQYLQGNLDPSTW